MYEVALIRYIRTMDVVYNMNKVINIALYVLWASLVAQLVKNLPAMGETRVQSLGWEDSLEKERAIPLQYSGLENSMGCIVHGVTKSRRWLSDFHLTSPLCSVWRLLR